MQIKKTLSFTLHLKRVMIQNDDILTTPKKYLNDKSRTDNDTLYDIFTSFQILYI